MRRILAHLLLALALLAAQQGAYAHALTHFGLDSTQQDGDRPAGNDCAVWHGFAATDAHASPATFAVDADVLSAPAAVAAQPGWPSSPLARFAIRAPPFLA